MELPALSLPPHPRLLALIPEPPAVEEEESLAALQGIAIVRVQTPDPLARRCQSLLVTGHALRGRIRPVGQKSETNIAVRIRQVMHFQPLDQLGDLGAIGQEGRHDNHRPQTRGHAVTQLEPRQHPRREQHRDPTIQERDHEVRGGNRGQKPEQDQARRHRPRCTDSEERQREREPTEDDDGSEVPGRRRRDVRAKHPARRGRPEANRQLEGRAPVRDEVVAGVISPGVVGVVGPPGPESGARREEHCFPGDVEFGPARAPRELFDRVPVAVAGREVHRGIGGAHSKHLVDQADTLEEFGPVECGHQTHARDDVPDGHVHRGQPLMLDPDDVVGCCSLGRQASV